MIRAAWAALLLVSASPASAREAPCRGCSVILVSLDALRADRLGFMGCPDGLSPRLDGLAARSGVFRSAFSAAPATLPSHASIFTGQYPTRHGVQVLLRDRLKGAAPLLAELLRERGYLTVWGAERRNWHLGLHAGLKRGFSETLEPDASSSFSRAAAWLRRTPEKPFFLFLQNSAAHDPYVPEESTLRLLNPARPLPKRIPRDELERRLRSTVLADPGKIFTRPAMLRHRKVFALPDPEARWQAMRDLVLDPQNAHKSIGMLRQELFWRGFNAKDAGDLTALRTLYDATVRETDQEVGRLLDVLRETGLEDDTLLVVTADHGEEFMEHGDTRHRQLYKECVHVPLLFTAGKRLPASRSTATVSSVDILPTVMDALGFPIPASAQGRSLVPALAAGPLPETPAFSFFLNTHSVRDGRHTYLLRVLPEGRTTEELYDRVHDPQETKDVAAAAPEASARLREALARQLTPRNPKNPENWPSWVREKVRQGLLKNGDW